MAVWKWKTAFTDVRECAVEADTEEEAQKKMDEGDWLYEHTIDFFPTEILEPLNGPHDE